MVNAGRILIVPKGVWSSLTSYDMLDLVTQDGVAYIARQANVGVQPKTDSQYTYWQPFGNASEPDNETIIYTENNKYTVNLDGKALVYDGDEGCITVAIDGTTIKFDEDEGYLYADVKSNLADLLDVVLTTPVNGQVLTYNALTGKWVNANPTGGMQAHLVITSEAGSTVTVTTPSGSVITATQVSGSTTQWECDTQEYGVHTIDAVLAGDDARITVTVDTCKVYNIDDSHVHATITVTFPQGFTCRCQGQGENYYSNSNPYTFSVHHLGEYTITATDGADTTYTETVTISSSAQSVSMFCPSVENAPTDDVQMWLYFGGITDKAYTTLSEVLADSTTLATLIADNNAVDYMVRSKSWCGIGLVPKMTSATTPSGEVVATTAGQYSQDGYFAFDRTIDENNKWASGTSTQTGQYVGYKFTSPQVIRRVMIVPFVNAASLATFKFKVQGYISSSDSWVDISNEITVTPTNLVAQYFTISNDTAYDGGRFYFTTTTQTNATILVEGQFYTSDADLTEDSTAMSYIGLNNYCANTLLADSDWLNAICNSQYFESVLNVKVPAMTSATTPSGIVSCDSERSGNEGFRAFDGVLNSDYNCWASAKTKNTNGIWIQYQFTSPLQIYKFGIQWASSWTSCSYTLKRSSDNITFKDIDSFTDSVSSNDWIYHNISDVFTDSCYRLDITSQTGSNTYGGNIIEVQFYGRQDV